MRYPIVLREASRFALVLRPRSAFALVPSRVLNQQSQPEQSEQSSDQCGSVQRLESDCARPTPLAAVDRIVAEELDELSTLLNSLESIAELA